MKKILLSIGILAFLFPKLVISQQGWVVDIPGSAHEVGGHIINAHDNNFVFTVNASGGLGGNLEPGNYAIKIDTLGNILWVKKYLDYTHNGSKDNITLTEDNGFIISDWVINSDSVYQNYLTKLDENGDIESASFFYWDGNTTVQNRITNILATSDGGYIFAGYEIIGSAYSTNLLVRKVDSNFEEVWTYSKFSGYNVTHITQNENDEIGVTGTLNVQDSIFNFIIKLDSSGTEIYESLYPGFFSTTKIIPTHDDGFISVTVNTSSSVTNARKVDHLGNTVWLKDISTPLNQGGIIPVTDITSVNGEGLVYSTFTYDPFTSRQASVLVKIDSDGNLDWDSKLDVKQDLFWEYCKAVTSTHDNGFIGIGSFNFQGDAATYIFKTDSLGQIYPNKIIGNIGHDEQVNCIIDSSESYIPHWIVSAQNSNQSFFTNADSLGNYILPVDTGDYIVNIHPPYPIWSSCENDINVSVQPNETISQDFPMEALIECPLMVVGASFTRARPCFSNNQYHVYYCNQGSVTAEDAYVEIEADPTLTYVNSTLPLSFQDGNTYTFDLGDVGVTECDNFTVTFALDCNVTIGESVCIESHIYPDSFCINDPNWNGAFVEVDATCQDSMVTFYLENTGTAGMPTPKEYVVIEDAILLIMNNFQLGLGQVDSISLPANGSTYQIFAEQVDNAPGDPVLTAWNEGCGGDSLGQYSLGLVNIFSQGDGDPYIDIDCRIASNAYDPNDKQGFPLGYGEEHYIRPNEDLEYLIRFQNTGTDTAYTVIIRDTIAPELDITSIQVGAASHSYTWRLYRDNILEFTFNTIMLPDSNVNEPESHGFIEFKISQKPDLPEGTIINNHAAIYFDYNDPIITNQTNHTIGLDFITVSVHRPIKDDYSLLVRPNPMQDVAIFEMKKEFKNGTFELYDISGRLAWQQNFTGKQFELKRNNLLQSGIYFYKISESGSAVNAGKLIIN